MTTASHSHTYAYLLIGAVLLLLYFWLRMAQNKRLKAGRIYPGRTIKVSSRRSGIAVPPLACACLPLPCDE